MSDSLRSLSDHNLLSNTDAIVAEDRKLTLRLLSHLHEIERRKLHLTLGYSSMFIYCTAHLRLSEPAAARRIRTARCLARIPELHALLASGEVNLSTVSMVAKYMKPENADAIISRIRGKSRREVERFVAEFEPRSVLPPDRVRVVVVPVPASAQAASWQITVAGDSEKSPSFELTPSETATIAMDRCAVIEFAAGEEFLELVERVRSIAAHRLPPNATFEQVFTLVMSEYVKREDPKARNERRESKTTSPRAGATFTNPRQIPAAVRDQVFARDKGRCTFVAGTGRRCEATRHLQIDHVVPIARGGTSTLDNLRLLCAHHNRLEAERLMGRPAPQALHREVRTQ